MLCHVIILYLKGEHFLCNKKNINETLFVKWKRENINLFWTYSIYCNENMLIFVAIWYIEILCKLLKIHE